MAGKINNLSGRRLFASLLRNVEGVFYPCIGKVLQNKMVRNLDLVPEMLI